MSVQRRFPVAMLSAAALAACGAAPSSGVKPPQQVLLTAAHIASTQSLRIDLNATESFSASGPAAQDFAVLGGEPITVSFDGAERNPRQAEGTLTANVAGHTFTESTVVTGGNAYVSLDGGKTYKVVSLGQAPTSQYGVSGALQYLSSVGSVIDEGPSRVDGVAVERCYAKLNGAKMTAVLRENFSSFQNAGVQAFVNALEFRDGSLVAMIDHSGRLVSESGTLSAGFNLGAIAASLRGSTLTLTMDIDAHLYDYGAPVTVAPPASITG